MRPPNVRACVEVSHRLTLEGHYGGVLIFLSSSVRAFVELVVCLAFPFMTSSVRLSFAAAHFSCGRISCSQSDQSGKPFFLQAKKHPRELRVAFIARLRRAVVWLNRTHRRALLALGSNQRKRAREVIENGGHRTSW